MKLRVNGESIQAKDGTTVGAMLEDLDLGPGRVAVAVNGTVVPRAEHASLVLEEGDEVEVIHAVAGG